MSRHHDELYLSHIQNAIANAINWTSQVTQAEFMGDEFVQSAIIRQLEIAGEAAGRLSEAFRQAHPEIEARRLKALRNVLIHGYADVDIDTVWDIVTHDLPALQRQLRGEVDPGRDAGD